jgi:hypothetical protein
MVQIWIFSFFGKNQNVLMEIDFGLFICYVSVEIIIHFDDVWIDLFWLGEFQ